MNWAIAVAVFSWGMMGYAAVRHTERRYGPCPSLGLLAMLVAFGPISWWLCRDEDNYTP